MLETGDILAANDALHKPLLDLIRGAIGVATTTSPDYFARIPLIAVSTAVHGTSLKFCGSSGSVFSSSCTTSMPPCQSGPMETEVTSRPSVPVTAIVARADRERTDIGVVLGPFVDGEEIAALARRDQVAAAVRTVIDREPFDIRGQMPAFGLVDQHAHVAERGIGGEPPDADILFGDEERAGDIVGDAAFGDGAEIETADLDRRNAIRTRRRAATA